MSKGWGERSAHLQCTRPELSLSKYLGQDKKCWYFPPPREESLLTGSWGEMELECNFCLTELDAGRERSVLVQITQTCTSYPILAAFHVSSFAV